MNNRLELVFFGDSTLLESPRWNKWNNSIMCVSIEQNMVYEIFCETGLIKTFPFQDQVGCLAIKDKKTVLVAEHTGIYELNLESGERTRVVQLNHNPQLRYNDGILDARGRFLVGTTGYNCLAENQNTLYSWNAGKKEVLIENITISNGIDFSKDGQYMYFVDSPTKKVAKYKYDVDTGSISYIQDVIIIEDGGMPDGICVDVDDTIWIAQWGGYKVSHWDPSTGKKLDEIKLPCKNVSACCIGGINLDELYITTAKHDDGTDSEELAGGLFKVKIRE